jgi:hypothetical protein
MVTMGVAMGVNMRRSQKTQSTLRRSVALPSALIGELKAVAPPELRTNLNRLVILSLQEYVSRRRRQEFARAVAAMAEDPQVQAECAAIARDFAMAEMDGIGND